MKQKIFLLTESDGFFGQAVHPWQSLNIAEIENILSAKFEVIRITWMQISTGEVCPREAIIIHSSSQQPEYKNFIDDLLLYLYSRGNHLVPSIHVTRSHENKGYQELHKRNIGIVSLPAIYACKVGELSSSNIEYPIVYKEVSGFGSFGVKLVHSAADIRRTASDLNITITPRQAMLIVRRWIGRLARWLIGRARGTDPSRSYLKPLKRFVLQDFIPGLAGDYKVIAFQDAIFVLKRGVLENDFRASGSGVFEFSEPPPGLLEYAKSMLIQFSEPYMSFDIAEKAGDYFLIEFQGLHFGPYTVMNAEYLYVEKDGVWAKEKKLKSFEEYLAESLVKFLSGAAQR